MEGKEERKKEKRKEEKKKRKERTGGGPPETYKFPVGRTECVLKPSETDIQELTSGPFWLIWPGFTVQDPYITHRRI